MPIVDKVATIATKIYGAAKVEYSAEAASRIEQYTAQVGTVAMCLGGVVVRTSSDCCCCAGRGSVACPCASRRRSTRSRRTATCSARPRGTRCGPPTCVRLRCLTGRSQLHIRDVRLSAGAGFLYFLVGDQVRAPARFSCGNLTPHNPSRPFPGSLYFRHTTVLTLTLIPGKSSVCGEYILCAMGFTGMRRSGVGGRQRMSLLKHSMNAFEHHVSCARHV